MRGKARVDLRHNSLKLPVLALFVVIFGVMAVTGFYVLVSVILLILALVAIILVASGNDPWWLRSPFDRRRND